MTLDWFYTRLVQKLASPGLSSSIIKTAEMYMHGPSDLEPNVGQTTGLSIASFKLFSDHLQKRRKGKKTRWNCDCVAALGSINTRCALRESIHKEFDELPTTDTKTHPDVEVLQNSSKKLLGYSRRKNPDWFDENADEVLPLLRAKSAALQAHLAHPASMALWQKWKSSQLLSADFARSKKNDGPTKLKKSSVSLTKTSLMSSTTPSKASMTLLDIQ